MTTLTKEALAQMRRDLEYRIIDSERLYALFALANSALDAADHAEPSGPVGFADPEELDNPTFLVRGKQTSTNSFPLYAAEAGEVAVKPLGSEPVVWEISRNGKVVTHQPLPITDHQLERGYTGRPLYAAPHPVAEGWKLGPVEPTEAMIEAAARAYCLVNGIDPDLPYGLKSGADAWWKAETHAIVSALKAAMLAAAPEATHE